MDDLILSGSSTAQLSRYRQAIRHSAGTDTSPSQTNPAGLPSGRRLPGVPGLPALPHLRKRNSRNGWPDCFFNNLLSGSSGHPAAHTAARPEWMSLANTGVSSPDLVLLQRMQGVINSYYGMMKHTTYSSAQGYMAPSCRPADRIHAARQPAIHLCAHQKTLHAGLGCRPVSVRSCRINAPSCRAFSP